MYNFTKHFHSKYLRTTQYMFYFYAKFNKNVSRLKINFYKLIFIKIVNVDTKIIDSTFKKEFFFKNRKICDFYSNITLAQLKI